jgi:hypothetical protein
VFPAGDDTAAIRSKFIRSQHELWGKVTREIGLKPE